MQRACAYVKAKSLCERGSVNTVAGFVKRFRFLLRGIGRPSAGHPCAQLPTPLAVASLPTLASRISARPPSVCCLVFCLYPPSHPGGDHAGPGRVRAARVGVCGRRVSASSDGRDPDAIDDVLHDRAHPTTRRQTETPTVCRLSFV